MVQKYRLFAIIIASLFVRFDAAAPTLTPSSYNFLTNDDIKGGYTTSEVGEYLVLTKSLFLKNNFNITSSTPVGGGQQNNILISITKSNITLDLNNQSIKTNKSGHIAIAIKDGIDGVTIKNGSIISGQENFHSAILIGRNCSNITLENITIEGGSDSNHGVLDFKGHSIHPVHNINLKNISIYNSSTSGIRCSHVHNLYLDNVICSSTKSNKKLAAIHLRDCKYITGDQIKTTLNEGTGETVGLKIENCKDAKFSNILSSSNDDHTVGAYTKNILIINSYNIQLDQVESTNTNNAQCGIGIINSRHVTLKNTIICNNHSGLNSSYSGICIVGSDSIIVDNCSISNCTSRINFNGISCSTSTCTDIAFKNIEISSNRALTGTFTGLNLTKSEFIILKHIIVSQNQSNKNTYGLKTTNSTKNLFCDDCHFVYNKSNTTTTNSIVAGVHIDGTVGVRLENCIANYNNGSAQAIGFYIASSNASEIKNCRAQLNWSSTSIAQAKNSAGFYLHKCNYSVLKNCNGLHNKGGSYAPGTSGSNNESLTTSCGGFGLINQGLSSDLPNIGNQFIGCVFNGNGTQLPNEDPGNEHKSFAGGRRYWMSQALSAGAIESFSRQTMYKECYFNNNGLSNYVVSGGLIITDDSQNIFVDDCIAANNGFYGYADLNTQCETYFLQSLTLGNGSYNPVATSVISSQTDRNVQISYGNRKPFYVIKMDDYSAIDKNNSKMHNYNIIGRRNSNEDD